MEACRVSTRPGKLRVDLEPDCGESVEAGGFYPMFFVSFFFRNRPGPADTNDHRLIWA